MVTSEELDLTFKKVGNDFGIETKAEFAAFRDLKIRWARTYNWAEFTVSDFLREAPLEAIEDIAVTIFSKIKGIEHEYSEETVEWLTSDEFADLNQSTYISRDLRIGSEKGEHKSIEKSLSRLKNRKLIPEDLGRIRFFWSEKTSSEQSSWSSMLMKVVTVNSALDSDEVPDEILDYAILRQIRTSAAISGRTARTGSRPFWNQYRDIRDSTVSRSGLENTDSPNDKLGHEPLI